MSEKNALSQAEIIPPEPSPHSEQLADARHSGKPSICDGQEFRRYIEAAGSWLEAHIELINSLNVYPVPDGDTGTNMYLTMQAALREISAVAENTISAVVRALAHGSLMGARGNSGVILSQIWRGVAKYLDGKTYLTASDWAQAMREGSAVAYKGVIRPVEGTILTVAREASEAALRAAAQSEDIVFVMQQALAQAQTTLVHTPDLLPVLKEAGVVDAGGQGLCAILEGILRYLRGEPTKVVEGAKPVSRLEPEGEPEHEYGYDVQFLVVGENLPIDAIRETIMGMGDSVLVVGDSTTIKVHIHSEDPGRIFSYATTQGQLQDVVLENMQDQYHQFLAKQSNSSDPALPTGEISTVAIVNGEGISQVFESLGGGALWQAARP